MTEREIPFADAETVRAAAAVEAARYPDLCTTPEDIDPASSGNDDAPDSTDPVMQWGVRWPDGAVTPQRDQEAAHATAGFWASLDEPCTVVSRICGPWRPPADETETQLGGLSRDS